MREVTVALGLSDDSGKTFQQEFDEAVSCSYESRMYGFVGAFVLGWVFNIVGVIWLGTGNVKIFALFYCLGSITSICGTCFLFGPCAQIKSMFQPIRAVATIVYLVSIALTIFVAIKVGTLIPIVACLVVQFCAYVYYCASYIPYGRAAIRNCLSAACPSFT